MTTSERPAGYTALSERIQRLKDAGACYLCHDLATGEVFRDQPTVADEERIRVVLDPNPKAHGHTIVVWKPHRADFSELEPEETAELFTKCEKQGQCNYVVPSMGVWRLENHGLNT